MTAVINLVILVLAGACGVLAVYFIGQALRARGASGRQAYDVGRQEARQSMQVNILRGGAAFFVSLILLGVYGLVPGPEAFSPAETEPPAQLATAEVILPLPTDTELPVATATTAPAPTIEPLTPTPLRSTETPGPAPTDTALPEQEPATAVVSSGVGVWLRAAPSIEGEQLEWLLQGTVLTLLAERKSADEFEWQKVVTGDGLEGWVALEFIDVSQP